MNTEVISLYDFSGVSCLPWAEAGHTCYAFDIQHPPAAERKMDWFPSGGSIHYIHADLHKPETFTELLKYFGDESALVGFGMAFPVCTDLSVAGSRHFAKKAERDPDFQTKAVNYAVMCADFFEALGVPYFLENPVSVLSTQWRKPNHRFHPSDFGGYIPEDQAEHPRWPQYIAPRDAYQKKTCLWSGGGFVMPEKMPVDPEAYHTAANGDGYSTAMMKLGGKSQRTKDIRSETPRGFANAVYQANKQETAA